jgi:hypothetical protein
VGGLGAKASRLDAKDPGLIERPLCQGIHRTAGVAQSAEYAVRTLHYDGKIGSGLVCRLSLADPGDPENE